MTSSSSPKTFILDTNVILHDSSCINNFQEHDIVVPEELDQSKKGNLTLNYYLIEKMQGQPLYAHINLEKGERSELAMLASELL